MAFASTIAVFVLLVSAHVAPNEGPAPPAVTPATVSVPAFQAQDLSGRRWTPADLRGRVVLIDFWATWCAPCLAELPRLKTLRAKHARKDFEIIGVSLDVTSRQSFVSWLNRNRIDWPQVHAKAGYSAELPRLFDVDRLPRTIVMDRDGSIAAMDVRGERLSAVIDRLLDRARENSR